MSHTKNNESDVVCVAAIRAGQIVTCTSCDRKDASHDAKYYRSIGYHSRIMTYDELEEFEQKAAIERQRMKEVMEG